ncbi:hypothetical protein QDY71_03780 [Kingella negevensis]|uniref:hypothetical protein n=1 Tax=Kingella negevensis TaxID=1522312 RepID=UPI0015DA7E14|nr:hypothetical protein [Kingella negevensis]MDK4684436.1 hypothetical protein [Kingella negevensis]MDK4696890.1 hypothetical protein [Kingella negevensis]MDK4708069.1 hypothetical protein [Kingella negevensis]MDK4709634.1 hypothetical protein [Kingella negevensis]
MLGNVGGGDEGFADGLIDDFGEFVVVFVAVNKAVFLLDLHGGFPLDFQAALIVGL